MYAASMLISAMVIVIPVLICLVITYISLLIITFRKGKDHLGRRIGWRFLWISVVSSMFLGALGLVFGILFGFIYQGESMTYDALAMTPENVVLTGGVGMELGWLLAWVLTFLVTTRSPTILPTPTTSPNDVVDPIHGDSGVNE